MPDIDVDFEDERRDEVINYVSRKYGQDHVAQIITFGTMLARAAIRDVGRVMGMGYGDVDRIAKAVPEPARDQAAEALAMSPQLKEMHDGDPQVAQAASDLAQQLEGVARNASTHAAGVVISREPLTELMPLQKATNSDALMTQYEMHGIEALGPAQVRLPRACRTSRSCARPSTSSASTAGVDDRPRPHPARRREDVRAAGLGRDDRRVPARVRGHAPLHPRAPARRRSTTSRPWSRSTARARWTTSRPTSAASTARSRSTYLHPLLEPYLDKTYGIFVYQEDIMAAAIALGGFTGPEADTLGYAIRKKKSSRPPRPEGEVRQPGGRARRRAAGHRRGVQGVRAVRALRVQQGPRHLLRADRVPDRVPQGELHGRVHDRRC